MSGGGGGGGGGDFFVFHMLLNNSEVWQGGGLIIPCCTCCFYKRGTGRATGVWGGGGAWGLPQGMACHRRITFLTDVGYHGGTAGSVDRLAVSMTDAICTQTVVPVLKSKTLIRHGV